MPSAGGAREEAEGRTSVAERREASREEKRLSGVATDMISGVDLRFNC